MDFAQCPCGNGQEGRPAVCPGRCFSLWKRISFNGRKLTFWQKMPSSSADGAQQELACKLKLLLLKRKTVLSAIRKTVVPLSWWGSLSHLNNLSLCAALYRCYKHTQLVFKSSPPPREPGKDNYSAVSILTSYLILSSGDFGALLVFLNASLCSCTFLL